MKALATNSFFCYISRTFKTTLRAVLWRNLYLALVGMSVMFADLTITCVYAQETGQDDDVTGFVINDASTSLSNEVYQFNADVTYNFSDNVLSAIQNGVPIIIVLDIEILQARDYLWGKLIAELKQRYKLQFHAISEQYIVENLNSGSREVFPTLHSALYVLRQIKALPLIDKKLLRPGKQYNGYAKVRIELESLPVPLRLNAYTTRSWWLGSNWFKWNL